MLSLVRSMILLGAALGSAGPAAARDLFVSSRLSDNVLRYDAETGAFKGVFASGNGLDNPNGIAFGPDGNLYVGLGDVGRVMIFDGASGAFLRDFVTPEASGGNVGARAIAFLPGGDLLVDSGGSSQVLRYEAGTGRFKGVFASGDGLNGPVGLTVASDGTVYVGGALDNRVHVYDPSGQPVRVYAPPAGQSNVTGVLLDRRGHLLVAHSVSNTVRSIDLATGENTAFASGGGLNIPINMIFLPGGDLLVGSFSNDKVVRYDGATGALKGDFILSGSGGLDGTHNFALSPATLDERFDGSWVIAGADKQGFFIDVSPGASTFFSGYFTYDPAGGAAAAPTWFVLQGALDGARSDFTAYRTRAGAYLGASPADLEVAGTGTIEVLACDRLALGLRLSGVAPLQASLQRLLPNAACQ
jgi:WD40 repeat protein